MGSSLRLYKSTDQVFDLLGKDGEDVESHPYPVMTRCVHKALQKMQNAVRFAGP